MRVNLSVAIVAMVNSSAIPHVNSTDSNVCPASVTNASSNGNDGEFAWTEAEQGMILGSFFWGYISTNILGGIIAEMYGGHIVLGMGIGITSLLTLLTPVAAYLSTELFIALRVAEGMSEGVTYPAMMSLMASWTPPLERSQAITLIFAGGYFGTVISMPVSGYLSASAWLGGWPACFYCFGALGLLWLIVWAAAATRTPESHPWMSVEEKLYIASSLQQQLHRTNARLSVPWRSIFTSMPFHATAVAHMASAWLFYVLLTELPTYLDHVLHFSLKQDAVVSSLPYIFMWVTSVSCGLLCDHLISSARLSTTSARKLFSSIGLIGPAVLLLGVTYTGCNAVLSVSLLTAAVGVNGAANSGFGCSYLDLAPNFAGTLMGLSNTLANTSGFLAPMMVGALISGQETLDRWRLVFIITAVIIVAGNLFYVIFYTGEVQPWNAPSYRADTRPAELVDAEEVCIVCSHDSNCSDT
ncbi:Major facilitator superfamily [Trinorchestia longiramus]|nr:Major facilitator superfamily [Trinorchestia longiramus]